MSRKGQDKGYSSIWSRAPVSVDDTLGIITSTPILGSTDERNEQTQTDVLACVWCYSNPRSSRHMDSRRPRVGRHLPKRLHLLLLPSSAELGGHPPLRPGHTRASADRVTER